MLSNSSNYFPAPKFNEKHIIESCTYQRTPLDDIFEIRLHQLHSILDSYASYSSYTCYTSYSLLGEPLMQNKNLYNFECSPAAMTSCCTYPKNGYPYEESLNSQKHLNELSQDLNYQVKSLSNIQMPFEVSLKHFSSVFRILNYKICHPTTWPR